MTRCPVSSSGRLEAVLSWCRAPAYAYPCVSSSLLPLSLSPGLEAPPEEGDDEMPGKYSVSVHNTLL